MATDGRTDVIVDTSTLMGFIKLARCSLATFVVIVAEKRYVVRSFGITFRILSMTGPKSISNRRSASSKTCAKHGIKTRATRGGETTHQKFDSSQTEPLCVLQMPLQPPRRCDDHMRSLGQRYGLVHFAHTTHNHGAPRAHGGSQGFKLLRYLKG